MDPMRGILRIPLFLEAYSYQNRGTLRRAGLDRVIECDYSPHSSVESLRFITKGCQLALHTV